MINTFNGSFTAVEQSRDISMPASKAKSVKREGGSKKPPFKSSNTSKRSHTLNSNDNELVVDTKSMGTSTDPEEEMAKSY